MISIEDYRKRVAKLYSNDRDKWRKKLEKQAPKGVKIVIPAGDVLPYTQAQFQQWMWSQIQLQAVLCPYCRAPIDILSMELDHKTPLRRGGDMSLSNRQCICRRCNQVKSSFTAEEFDLLVQFMSTTGAHFRERLEGLLISGSMGQMMRHWPNHRKPKKEKPTQEALYFSELGDF